jgi:hypothetical protein
MTPKETTRPGGDPLVAEPGKPRRQDNTARYRKIAQDEFGSLAGSFEKKVKHLKFWFTLIVGIAGFGFAAASFLGKDSRRIDVLETKVDDMRADIQEIMRAVGAIRRVEAK